MQTLAAEKVIREPEYILFNRAKISNIDFGEARSTIKNGITRKGYVCLTDAGVVAMARKDPELQQALGESLLSIPDGMPLVWYGKLSGCRKIERISGGDLFKFLLEEDNGYVHFLLGDTEETISRVIRKAKSVNRGIRISGYSPPFKEDFGEADTAEIIDKINEASPDLIWVSFGGVKQNKWMRQHLSQLDRGVMIGVGAAFRYYIGALVVPPRIIQTLGLQWFYRMLANPRWWFRFQAPKLLRFLLYFPVELFRSRQRLNLRYPQP